MLDTMTNPAIIEHVVSNHAATEMEMELADRLHAAMDELDRLTEALRATQAPQPTERADGTDA